MENTNTKKSSSFQQSSELSNCLTRLYFSRGTCFFYAGLLLLSIGSLIYVVVNIGTFPSKVWFIVLEVVLCTATLLELVMRVLLAGVKEFYRKYMNLVDLAATVLSIVLVSLAFWMSGLAGDLEGLFGILALICRNAILVARIVLLYQRRKNLEEHSVNFVKLEEEPQNGKRTSPIKEVYKPNLDTLVETDEIYESSLPTSSPSQRLSSS